MAHRIMKDIPELVQKLRDQAARCKDLVVTTGAIGFAKDEKELAVKVRGAAYRVQPQTHGQLAQKFGEIPKAYYDRMLATDPEILVKNLEFWRNSQVGLGKKHLLRLIDDHVRALLSDRYRPISDLDILTTGVQVITGRDGEEKSYAKGAICFDWAVSPTRMSVGIMNPGIQIDLNHLDKGVQFNAPGGYSPDRPNHGWVRAQTNQDGSHWVFPAAFFHNSETGHGGLSVQTGLYEAACDNAVRTGVNLAQRHLGKALEEGELYYSPDTQRKENALIFAKVADVVRNAFDPELLLANAKKMKGLADLPVDNVVEVVNEIVKLPGLTEDLRDEILGAYRPMSESRKTLLDVQRAVTAAAHAVREAAPEKAMALEELGGAMIENGAKALVVAKK